MMYSKLSRSTESLLFIAVLKLTLQQLKDAVEDRSEWRGFVYRITKSRERLNGLKKRKSHMIHPQITHAR